MKLRQVFFILYTLLGAQFLTAQGVLSMGSSSDSTKAEKPAMTNDFMMGKKLIEEEKWAESLQSFEKVIKEQPKNADAFNLLGYANRQLGQYDQAFDYYNRALEINPKHKGANEYIGEAYLKVDDLANAKKHLAVLDDICTFGCPEYTMLKRAVADYKK